MRKKLRLAYLIGITCEIRAICGKQLIIFELLIDN